jgi:hypothetical protein
MIMSAPNGRHADLARFATIVGITGGGTDSLAMKQFLDGMSFALLNVDNPEAIRKFLSDLAEKARMANPFVFDPDENGEF